MFRIPNWMADVLNQSAREARILALAQQVVSRVEPELWSMIADRLHTFSFAEAKGYAWARSAPVVKRAVSQLEREVPAITRIQVIERARAMIADHIVKQLRASDVTHSGKTWARAA